MDYKVSCCATAQAETVHLLISHRDASSSSSRQPVPTVTPAAPFDAAADAQTLRAAMKGFGTDEQEIIDVLAGRSNQQRQTIRAVYEAEFERDLVEDLKSELGGKFEDVIVGLTMPPVEYLCKQLHAAMACMGTEEATLVEILCTKSNEEMAQIVAAYEERYQRPLAEQMCSETSGFFRRLLTLIVTGVRDGLTTPTDANEAKEQAAQLYAAGEAKLGTDEEVFNRIMSHASFPSCGSFSRSTRSCPARPSSRPSSTRCPTSCTRP